MKNKLSSLASTFGIIVATLIVSATFSVLAQVFTAPPSTPPNGNVSTPLNVGSTAQVKQGGSIQINGGFGIAGGPFVYHTATAPIAGQVLTALDATGTVAWVNAGGGSGGNGLNIQFVTPTVLAGPIGGGVAWTTVSNLVSNGVPANATAVILGTTIQGCNINGWISGISERADASSPTYILAKVETAGGGAPVLANFNQGIYPISSTGSFQYSSDANICGPSNIVLYGYVTPGGSGGGSSGINGMQVFDASGSWTAPAGVTKVVVEAWGGGQASYSPSGSPTPIVNGLGGHYAKGIYAVTSGTSYPITVGDGGVSGGGGIYQGNGSDSTFSNLVLAAGGGSASVDVGMTTIETAVPKTNNKNGNLINSPGGSIDGASPNGGSVGAIPGGGGVNPLNTGPGAHGRVIVYW